MAPRTWFLFPLNKIALQPHCRHHFNVIRFISQTCHKENITYWLWFVSELRSSCTLGRVHCSYENLTFPLFFFQCAHAVDPAINFPSGHSTQQDTDIISLCTTVLCRNGRVDCFFDNHWIYWLDQFGDIHLFVREFYVIIRFKFKADVSFWLSLTRYDRPMIALS